MKRKPARFENKTTAINLFGGPGTGKSSTAYVLAGMMKWEGFSCKLVTEYAKDRVWDGDLFALRNQIYVFGKQHHRMFRLKGKVDFIVTDSPLLLSCHYDRTGNPALRRIVLESVNEFLNLNIFLLRQTPYCPVGRLQTEQEAKSMDAQIRNMLVKLHIDFHVLPAEQGNHEAILRLLRTGDDKSDRKPDSEVVKP